jgi:hypothetical protein
VLNSASEYLSECSREAKWPDVGALAGWTGCCDEMWLTVVASKGVPLSWQKVLWLYWIVLYHAMLLLSWAVWICSQTRLLLSNSQRTCTPFGGSQTNYSFQCFTDILLLLNGLLAVQQPTFIQRSVGPSALPLATHSW